MFSSQKLFFGILWFFFGIFILFCLGFSDKSFLKQPLLREIDKLSMATTSNKEFIKNLPNIFDRDYDLRVIILENEKGQISGGMYNSIRINKNEYSKILERYRKAISQKEIIIDGKNMIIYDTLFQEKVYLHFSKLIGFSSFVSFIINSSFISWLFGIIYLGLGFLISRFLFDSLKVIKKQSHTNIGKIERDNLEQNLKQDNLKISTHQNKNFLKKDFSTYIKKTYLRDLQIFESQIKWMVNQIYKIINCPKISFFLFENKAWKPYIQKYGQLFIKGNFSILTNIDLAKKQANIIHKDMTSIMITFGSKKEILGLFVLEFINHYTLALWEEESLLQLISSSASSLLMQKKFEESTIDEETSFYTFPYFSIQLNNKITNKIPLATLAFEILNFDKMTSNTLKVWGREVTCKIQLELNKVFLENHQSLIARIKQNRFVLIVETDIENLYFLSNILKEIEKFSYYLGKKPIQICSCVIPNMYEIKNIESYLRILEQFMLTARHSKEKKIGQVA